MTRKRKSVGGCEESVSTSRAGLILTILIGLLALSPISQAVEVGNCQNIGSAYGNALEAYESNSSKADSEFKELAKLKKEADKLREACIKTINNDFKNALREINLRYAISGGTKQEKLSQKTKKNSEVAAATLERDKRMRSLVTIPELPEKPIKTKTKSRKS